MAIDQEPDVSELDDEQELGDAEDADDEVDDEDEEPDALSYEDDDEDDDAEGGGDEAEDSDGKPEVESVVALSGKALLDALFSDAEAQTSLVDAVQEYQRQLAEQEGQREQAEKIQKLIDDQDYEAIGKLYVDQEAENKALAQAKALVSGTVTTEVFGPVYKKLFAEPEMAEVADEDKVRLNVGNFENHADHIRAIQDYISTKRAKTDFDTAVKAGVEEALTAERNKKSAALAKTSSLSGRSPQSVGTATGKQTSSDLLKSGLRALINPDDSGDDDE